MVRFRSMRHQRGDWRSGVRFDPARPNDESATNRFNRRDTGQTMSSRRRQNVNRPLGASGFYRVNGQNAENADYQAVMAAAAQASNNNNNGGNDPLADVPKSLFEIDLQPDNTFVIEYKGVCGREHPGVNGGDGVNFTFTERVPAHLCFRGIGVTVPQSCDQTGKYIAAAIDRHNQRILDMRVWECQFCGEKARELCHSAVPFFNPPTKEDETFRPYLWDFVVPICRSLGGCDAKAEKHSVDFMNKHYEGPVTFSGPTCQNCGGNQSLLTCGSCRRVQYCSKDCQKKDWSDHKPICRLAQKDAAKKENDDKGESATDQPRKEKAEAKDKEEKKETKESEASNS